MTRVLFLSLVVGGVLLAALAGGAGSAAPIPKGAYDNTTPDLKAFFTTVGKAVEDGKWPADADEKKLRDTARVIFERATKAAEVKDRKLPVDFDKLTKAEIAKEFRQVRLDGTFVVAGDVRITSARDSVIFATGNVQITGAWNCVIVAQNVRCTGVHGCVIVAGDYIRVTGAHPTEGGDGPVLVAGQWIRATGLDKTICHVLRPGTLPSPDEGKFGGNMPHPAIGTNGAKNVIYLNDRSDTSGGSPDQQTYLPQKMPIAK